MSATTHHTRLSTVADSQMEAYRLAIYCAKNSDTVPTA